MSSLIVDSSATLAWIYGDETTEAIRRVFDAVADNGALVPALYRGRDAQNPRRVFISGQKRGVFGIIKRELRRRFAIEPLIGHLEAEGHLGRCYLKGRAGDAANAILFVVGYNFRRVLAWLRALLRLFLIAILCPLISRSRLIPAR